MTKPLHVRMLIAAIALLGAGFIGGCQLHPDGTPPAHLIAPWSGAYATPVRAPAGMETLPESTYAFQMLGDQDFFYGRPEKFAWGTTTVTEVSAYSDYQYDVQPIGLPRGSGYRYRSVARTVISVP